MTDFATLVLAADSRGLVTGEQALDRLATAAEKTERRTAKSLSDVGKAAEQVGKQSAFASQNSRMMAMQLSQVAQQASATGNVLQAIAIQLPDLALGFGPIGIAAGAAAGAVLAYFASYEDGGDANQILKEQEELIRQVADRWGEAAPALQAYIDTLDRAKTAAEDAAAQQVFADEQFRSARDALPDLIVGFDDLTSKLRLAGEEQENIGELERAFQALQEAVESNSDPTDELKNLQTALADAAKSSGIPAIDAFSSSLYSFGNAALTAAGNVETLVKQMSVAQTLSSIRGLNAPLGYENPNIPDPSVEIPTPDRRPLIELDGLPGEFGRKGRKGRNGGKTQTQLYDDIVAAANRRITSLEAEKTAIGLTDEAAAKLLYTTDLFNDAQQKGIELSGPQREQLTTLAETMARVEEETRQASEAMEFQKDVLHGIFGDLRDALDDGKITWVEFGDIAMGVLDKVIDKIQDDLVDAMVNLNSGSAGGGGFLSGLFSLFGGGGGASADPWAGMRVTSFDGGGYTGKRSRSGGMDGKGGFLSLLHPDETVIDHTKSGGSSVSEREGRTVIEVRMSPDVEARIVEKSASNTVEIVKQNNKNRQEAYTNGDNAYG